MLQLPSAQKLAIRRVRLARALRAASGQAQRTVFRRWRHKESPAERFRFAPPDLRSTDTSFALELADDAVGLAGFVVELRGRSPFAIEPPNELWLRELAGFGWLRNMQADNSPFDLETETACRSLALDWIKHHPAKARGATWEVPVLSRRILSWIANSGLLLDGSTPEEARLITASLGSQIAVLARDWRGTREGAPRLQALVALVEAGLCIEGFEHVGERALAAMTGEFARQVLPDGGHVSRNGNTLLDLLLDLLPLRQCFLTRAIAVPAELDRVIGGLLAMLRFLQMGDGALARFQGVGPSRLDDLATVLAYGEGEAPPEAVAAHSGFARIQRGQSIVVMDVGCPPPIVHAGQAHASALAFEMSSGRALLFVSRGMPGAADADWSNVARSTASHNTLTIGAGSSGQLLTDRKLCAAIGGGVPIAGPQLVAVEATPDPNTAQVAARHDGYLPRLGLLHRRQISMSVDGRRLMGVDSVVGQPVDAAHVGGRPCEVAVHFHLHPASATVRDSRDSTLIRLANGHIWRLGVAAGATLSIEESVWLCDPAGPSDTLQIVLRARMSGNGEIRWLAEQLAADDWPVEVPASESAPPPLASDMPERFAVSPVTARGETRPDDPREYEQTRAAHSEGEAIRDESEPVETGAGTVDGEQLASEHVPPAANSRDMAAFAEEASVASKRPSPDTDAQTPARELPVTVAPALQATVEEGPQEDTRAEAGTTALALSAPAIEPVPGDPETATPEDTTPAVVEVDRSTPVQIDAASDANASVDTSVEAPPSATRRRSLKESLAAIAHEPDADPVASRQAKGEDV